MTIIRYRPSDAVAGPGTAEVFFQEKGQPPGLTLALGVLQRGAVVVGVVSTPGGGDRAKLEDQPDAKPDAERPVPDARWDVPGRAEG